jgi:enoyl-[acyl-carrier-protein] reductase (NADH)
MNQHNHSNKNSNSNSNINSSILASLPCNVQTDLPSLFHDVLPDYLEHGDRKIDAIVHSLAYANFEGHADKLSQASWEAFAQAQHISAYSFLETARCATESNLLLHSSPNTLNVNTDDTDNSNNTSDDASSSSVLSPLSSVSPSSSLTALSYIGAVRSVPGYHIMGPAKASLEAIVRGLAAELGTNTNSHDSGTKNTAGTIRVNCVSAGPVQTAAARGIPGFSTLAGAADRAAPTGNPDVSQVANVVQWVADSAATGVTGQTIYVDGGYSTTMNVSVPPAS